MKCKLSVVLGVAVAVSLNASASLLWNVDFQGASGVMSGAAVVGSAGDHWNSTGNNPTTTAQVLVLGDSTGDFGNTISMSYFGSQNGGGFYTDGSSDLPALMDGFSVGQNGGSGSSFAQMTFTLTGLMANTQYDIVAYGASLTGTDRGTHFFDTVGGSILGSTDGSTTVIAGGLGKSYTTFSITSDGSGALTIYSNYNSGSSAQGPVNGFQIQAIPEPATIGLVGLFGGGILFIRRRIMM